MKLPLHVQAAVNIAGESVSVEPDGTCWTGTDPDRTYLDTALVQAEYERLEDAAVTAESDRQTALEAARDHAANLGFTEAMLAVMYPQLEGE